jgi:hypothetical protein
LEYRCVPPYLGNDTEDILVNLLGLNLEIIDLLVEKKVVGVGI